jgi:hypothetical protein
MGYVSASEIEGAVNYLLPILQAENSVKYSRFYDGTDECHDNLQRDIAPDNKLLSPELLIDLAVAVLEEHGVVRRVELDEKLFDDEKNYRIDLVPGQPIGAIRVRGIDL